MRWLSVRRPMKRRDADHVRLRIGKGEQRLGIGAAIAGDADGRLVDDHLARQRQPRGDDAGVRDGTRAAAHQISSAIVCSQSRRFTCTSSWQMIARCTAAGISSTRSRQQHQRASHADGRGPVEIVGDRRRRRSTPSVCVSSPLMCASESSAPARATIDRSLMSPMPSHSSRATIPREQRTDDHSRREVHAGGRRRARPAGSPRSRRTGSGDCRAPGSVRRARLRQRQEQGDRHDGLPEAAASGAGARMRSAQVAASATLTSAAS